MAFIKAHKKIICIIAACVLVLAGGLAAIGIWQYNLPKFQNVTLELGTESVGIASFMTEHAKPHKVGFVSDTSVIDLGKVGTTELTLSHGRKQETVNLTVEDTTAPEVEFLAERVEFINYVPEAGDFVLSVSDHAETTVRFARKPEITGDYEEIELQVVVEDASGNKTTETCVLKYVWMTDRYTLELGEQLRKEDILLNAEQDGHLVDQEQLDLINGSGVGEYILESTSGGRTLQCIVTVQDTTAPTLELREVAVYKGGKADVDDFLVSVWDASGDVEVKIVSTMDFSTISDQVITIEAEDIHGNITTMDTVLHVTYDVDPPSISGLRSMTVDKHSQPDFMKGVSAWDAKDGTCQVTVNTDGVNLSKAGTYYAVYSARDKSGNLKTAKRKIVVNHDYEDTLALVKSIAAKLPSDPEAIRDYVRNSISYSTDWGGEDPTWFGFQNHHGNCYVHAMTLQALLTEKGYTTKLIWVTNKTHYWLQIQLNGQWKHIDATPGNVHTRYSLMNDQQRLETLKGRVWDTTKWPACP